MTSLAELSAPLAADLQAVLDVFDRELDSDLPFVNELTEQVRRYRGKLLRPQLLLLTARAVGDVAPEHVTLAAVLEMVHMATLVHDDVLDEADVRRREQTVNRLIGNEGAVLLGDFLISHAYHLCSSLGSNFYSRRIAGATNTVCEGELMQIRHRGDLDLREQDYLEIIRRKTAALTSVACELGAGAPDGDPRVIGGMAAFGENLGIAFQIIDDLLDLTAGEDEVGKSVGRDAEMGKLTLPLIRYLDRADESERRRVASLLGSEKHSQCEQLRSLLTRSGAIEESYVAARGYIDAALGNLTVLPPGESRDALTASAEFVLARRK